MANSSYTQQALAADAHFQLRVRAALATVAWQVLNETPQPPNYTARSNFARGVLGNLAGFANQIAPWLVMRTNLFAFTTSYDFPAGAVVTASGDADIEAQLSTDWDEIAGA